MFGLALFLCIILSGFSFVAVGRYNVVSILCGLHNWPWLLLSLRLRAGYVKN
jgi:hypothetical protein